MKDNADYCTAPVLGGLELLSAQYYRQNFAKHTHEGYTVAVIEQGAQRFYRTGGPHHCHAGWRAEPDPTKPLPVVWPVGARPKLGDASYVSHRND